MSGVRSESLPQRLGAGFEHAPRRLVGAASLAASLRMRAKAACPKHTAGCLLRFWIGWSGLQLPGMALPALCDVTAHGGRAGSTAQRAGAEAAILFLQGGAPALQRAFRRSAPSPPRRAPLSAHLSCSAGTALHASSGHRAPSPA